MKKELLSKTLVMGIVILFVGASIFPVRGIINNNEPVYLNQIQLETKPQNRRSNSVDDEWHMYKHDAQGLCSINSLGPFEPSLKWTFNFGPWDAAMMPIIADGKVYMGTDNEDFYCFDADTGEIIWKKSLPGGVGYSSPAYYEGKIYQGAVYDFIYCWDADNGDIIWSFYKGYGRPSSPVISDGKLYILKDWYNFSCLDAENGTELWSHQFSTPVYSDPIVYEGKTYIGEDIKGRLYCFNADNGSVIWDKYISGEIYGPAIIDDKVYSKGGRHVWCLNATTGEKIWSYFINSIPWCSPSVADGRVYFCGNDTRCFDADTGEVLWYKPSGDCYFISVCQESIYIGYKSNRSVACLDAFDGSLQWEYQFESGRMMSSSAVAYNKLYVISMETEHRMYPRLHCFEGSSRPPTVPTINGPPSGKVGTSYNYVFNSVDPEGKDVYYYIRWGDSHVEVWDGPHDSGIDVTIDHTYTRQGSFTIEAKAKDSYGSESDWSNFTVTIPRDKTTNNVLLWILVERFPLLDRLLNIGWWNVE